jgi:predicted DNA binding CopG/RHH family protein
MLIKTTSTDGKVQTTNEKILSSEQKTADSSVSIRISSEQLQHLKLKSKSEKRTIANYIKSKLF